MLRAPLQSFVKSFSRRRDDPAPPGPGTVCRLAARAYQCSKTTLTTNPAPARTGPPVSPATVRAAGAVR